ncbi:MAG: hypothetical protein ACHRHE_11760 [Tepidisphaerales bacterium]
MRRRLIHVHRLAALLAQQQYVLEWDSGASVVNYARPSLWPQLWEEIAIFIGGRRGDVVSASVAVKVGYSTSAAGLGVDQHVAESTRGQKNGYRLIDEADAESWERDMAQILPGYARRYANEAGPELLVRTAEARSAAARYLQAFEDGNCRKFCEDFERRATAEQIREARRIAKAFSPLASDQEFYVPLILGLILCSETIEGRQVAPPGVRPWPEGRDWVGVKSPDWSLFTLVWRLQLVADRWLSRYPEPMPQRLEEWCRDRLPLACGRAGPSSS